MTTTEPAYDVNDHLEFDHTTESWRYTGDLDHGKDLVNADFAVAEGEHLHETPGYTVVLALVGDDTEATWDNHSVFGHSESGDPEEAWRYLLGAEFGPPVDADGNNATPPVLADA